MDALMNTMPGGGGKPETMTSLEISEVVNSAHADVRRSIERLAERGVITLPPTAEVSNPRSGPKTINVYQVSERESYIVVAQLSPEFTASLVDFWQKNRHAPAPAIPTTAEALAQVFRMVADSERREAQQNAFNSQIAERVEIVEQTAALKAKPQNAETRSEARRRMNRVHGLSEVIVDTVLDHPGYGIRPFAMVKNSHEDAQGSSYGVYWIRDISALFKRFASECTPHSPTMVRHPIISRPFKLAKGGAK